jgi:hypothetical protein
LEWASGAEPGKVIWNMIEVLANESQTASDSGLCRSLGMTASTAIVLVSSRIELFGAPLKDVWGVVVGSPFLSSRKLQSL